MTLSIRSVKSDATIRLSAISYRLSALDRWLSLGGFVLTITISANAPVSAPR